MREIERGLNSTLKTLKRRPACLFPLCWFALAYPGLSWPVLKSLLLPVCLVCLACLSSHIMARLGNPWPSTLYHAGNSPLWVSILCIVTIRSTCQVSSTIPSLFRRCALLPSLQSKGNAPRFTSFHRRGSPPSSSSSQSHLRFNILRKAGMRLGKPR